MSDPEEVSDSSIGRLYEASCTSEIGPVREDNQDYVRIPSGEELSSPDFLCAVADGMGGYEHGGLASKLAIDAIFEKFYEPNHSVQRSLEEGMEDANLRVLQTGQRLGASRMGTTLTAAAISGQRLWIAHAGDSRAYLLRGGYLRCLTEDHTAVGDLVRMKIISAAKVRTHAQRSILTRAVGLGLFLQPDVISLRPQPGDRLVLCSDGLWSAIEDEDIRTITADTVNPEELNRELVALALRRNTDDNASVVSVFIHSFAEEAAASQAAGGWLDRIVRGLFSTARNGASPR